ncbi:hypothetical protein N0V84_007066 [Fusarium piperis]|uniref:FMN-dependent dehydrogenase domain-containing protein n=1 Tax=Fusarium piperis TaxID=1435070 RepID=A0A9W8WAT9_9HYPO|nr:hypothetical protein N0V84_007066 [Fusarium piperis]
MASDKDPKSPTASIIEPDSASYASFQRDIYQALRPPLFSTKPSEWEALARSKVPAANFDYVHGSAGTSATADANVEAFSRPLLVAPIGVQNIMHSDAEEATAMACHHVGIPMILSSAATRTIEQVAEANANGD